MRKPLLLLLLPLLLCTCDSAQPDEAGDVTAFYDLKGYIDSEVSRLEGTPLTVEKTITLNGTTETQEISDLDFEKDLRLFAGADINKAAWKDKYETETEELSGQHRITRYTALDTTLTTQFLEVEEDFGQTIRLRILRKTGTILSEGRSEMDYVAAKGYSVATRQDNRFGEDVDALVKVSWR